MAVTSKKALEKLMRMCALIRKAVDLEKQKPSLKALMYVW